MNEFGNLTHTHWYPKKKLAYLTGFFFFWRCCCLFEICWWFSTGKNFFERFRCWWWILLLLIHEEESYFFFDFQFFWKYSLSLLLPIRFSCRCCYKRDWFSSKSYRIEWFFSMIWSCKTYEHPFIYDCYNNNGDDDDDDKKW